MEWAIAPHRVQGPLMSQLPDAQLCEHPPTTSFSCPPETAAHVREGFPGSSAGKESACNAGDARDAGSVPGLISFRMDWLDLLAVA